MMSDTETPIEPTQAEELSEVEREAQDRAARLKEEEEQASKYTEYTYDLNGIKGPRYVILRI
jgi:hypothetical protein